MTSIGSFALVEEEIYDEMKRRIQNPSNKRSSQHYERWTEDKDLYNVQNETLVLKRSNQIIRCERVWLNTVQDIMAQQIIASRSCDANIILTALKEKYYIGKNRNAAKQVI